MKPPVRGPRASESAPAADDIPIARARSFASLKVSEMIASVEGMVIAAPTPCSARPVTSTVSLSASPLSSEAAVKTARPVRNIRRLP